MMERSEILAQLRSCPECDNDEVSWCQISRRPYCNCGHWGKTNFGSDQDAIDAWNEKTEHEKYLDLKADYKQLRAELEQAQNELIKVRVCLQSEINDLKIENKLQALEYITLFGEMQTLLERGDA